MFPDKCRHSASIRVFLVTACAAQRRCGGYGISFGDRAFFSSRARLTVAGRVAVDVIAGEQSKQPRGIRSVALEDAALELVPLPSDVSR